MGNDASSPFNAEGEVTKLTQITNYRVLLLVLFFVRPFVYFFVFVLFFISPNKDDFIVCSACRGWAEEKYITSFGIRAQLLPIAEERRPQYFLRRRCEHWLILWTYSATFRNFSHFLNFKMLLFYYLFWCLSSQMLTVSTGILWTYSATFRSFNHFSFQNVHFFIVWFLYFIIPENLI